MNKSFLLFFATLGGLAGGYLPVWMGNDDMGLSILTGTVGGLVGIWLGVVIARRLG